MIEEVKRCLEMLRLGACCGVCHRSHVTDDDDYECEHRGAATLNMNKAADLIESLSAELEHVKRERDAAVEDMERGRICCACKHEKSNINEEPCNTCTRSVVGTWPNWQWRGVKE